MLTISVHGIHADYPWNWQDELYSLWPSGYRTYKYGVVTFFQCFPLPKKVPAALQRLPGDAQKFYQAYSRIVQQHRTIPSVIAHSYGSVILAQALKTFDQLLLDKIILLGTVVPEDFDWPSIWSRGQFVSLRNELAFADLLVEAVGKAPQKLRQRLQPYYGQGGTLGFRLDTQRYPWFSEPTFPGFGHSSHHVTTAHAQFHWGGYLAQNPLHQAQWVDMALFDRWFAPLLYHTLDVFGVRKDRRDHAYGILSAKIAFHVNAGNPLRPVHEFFRDFTRRFRLDFAEYFV